MHLRLHACYATVQLCLVDVCRKEFDMAREDCGLCHAGSYQALTVAAAMHSLLVRHACVPSPVQLPVAELLIQQFAVAVWSTAELCQWSMSRVVDLLDIVMSIEENAAGEAAVHAPCSTT